MLESQDIMSWKVPTKDHWVQFAALAENEALFKQPSQATFTSKIPGMISSKGQETAQQPLMQTSQDPWAQVSEHSMHDRAAEVSASSTPSLSKPSWQEGDDTHQGYKTTFILSPEAVNKHVTTDEATGNYASCFHWCIAL